MEMNEYAQKLFQVAGELDSMKVFGDPDSFSRTEYRLLQEVVSEREKGNDIISSELARRLGVTRSAISQTVDKLVSRGIVVRVSAEHDKKIAYVRLSEKALSEYEAQCDHARELLTKVAAKFGKSRTEDFLKEYEEFLRLVHEAQEDNRKQQREGI